MTLVINLWVKQPGEGQSDYFGLELCGIVYGWSLINDYLKRKVKKPWQAISLERCLDFMAESMVILKVKLMMQRGYHII